MLLLYIFSPDSGFNDLDRTSEDAPEKHETSKASNSALLYSSWRLSTEGLSEGSHPRGSNLKLSDSLSSLQEYNISVNSLCNRDHICISCGDEFECEEDLDTHAHLCFESARLAKNIDSEKENVLEVASPQGNDANSSNSGDMKVDKNSRLKIVDSGPDSRSLNNDTVKESHEESMEEEPSYPKTRRALRSRKAELVVEFSSKSLSLSPHSVSVMSARENSSSTDCEVGTKDIDTTISTKSSSQKDENVSGEDKKSDGFDNSAIQEMEERHSSSGNDDNNNDVHMHDDDSHGLSTKSLLQDRGESNIDASDASKARLERPFHGEGHNQQEGDENFEKNISDFRGGPGILRQWRQEFQNSSPVNSFTQSTPNHKCLICCKGFWDRKSLSNHWRQNHGVRVAMDEDDENSCSDHETEPDLPDVIVGKSATPKGPRLMTQTVARFSPVSAFKSTNPASFPSVRDARDSELSILNQNADDPLLPKIKNEFPDLQSPLNSTAEINVYRNQIGKSHSFQFPVPTGNFNPMNEKQSGEKSVVNATCQSAEPSPGAPWMTNAPFLAQENAGHVRLNSDCISVGKNAPNVNPAATPSEIYANYIKQCNKIAEWYMSQGAQFCQLCMGVHVLGKCPKATFNGVSGVAEEAGNNNPNSNSSCSISSKVEQYGAGRDSINENSNDKHDDTADKVGENEDGPLDMSKSAADFTPSFHPMTPSSSGCSSKSSSINSSGHSSGLGLPASFLYPQMVPDSHILDMSTPRLSEGREAGTPLNSRDLALTVKKTSPVSPNLPPFGTTPFPMYHPPPTFSAIPSLPSLNSGPGVSSAGQSMSTPVLALSKSSGGQRKKVSSRQGFPCKVCNRVFQYQTALFTHMHNHSPSARSYQCQLCNQTFARAPDLKVHVCPNGNEKPFSCPSCGQTFAKNIHLKRHLATHSGLKPYPCWVCGKRFSRSDHLKRHTQSIHAGARPHVCQICGKEFVRKYELNKHMQSHEQPLPPFEVS